MNDLIAANLSRTINPTIVKALLASYSEVITHFRKGAVDVCLSCSGKFVENVLRAVEFLRTGKILPEIKSASSTVKDIEKDATLPESLRILVPRVAYAMIFDLRSKRGAVHVKEINPKPIDAALVVQAASWIVAELLRLYHSDDDNQIATAMNALSRTNLPYVETFGDERVVTRSVPCNVELLLLLASSVPNGMSRKELGQASKYPAPRISEAVRRLEITRQIHKTKAGVFHVTGTGEQMLANAIASS